MKYIYKGDVIMIALIPVLCIMQLYLNVFNIYVVIILSGAYGGYLTLKLFVIVQTRLAIKKGLLSQLEDINRIEKRDRNDKPRWIK